MSTPKVRPRDLGGLLAQIRAATGLSRREFADRLGLNENYIYLLESGRKRPTRRLWDLIDYHFWARPLLDQLGHHAAALASVRHDPARGARERGALEAALSAIERVCRLAEQGGVVAETTEGAQLAAPIVEATRLDVADLAPAEREALARFASALRSGDAQIRAHLVQQMEVVERALAARRRRPRRERASAS